MPQVKQPVTWGEVADFVKANRLDQEEYFSIDHTVTRHAPIWGPDVWNIAVWVVEGSNEGFYLHVDAIIRDPERPGGRRVSKMLGKFWNLDTAMDAVDLLTRYIYGFRQRASPTWKGG
jgi:hypothetical protein